MTRLRMHWCEQLVRRPAIPDGASRHESATLPQCACGPLSGDCLNLVGLRTVFISSGDVLRECVLRGREMPNNLQSVIPMLSYEDGFATLDWLCAVFGFKEKTRMVGPDGRLALGEVLAGDGLIMLASPTP